jgi:alanyl-tRNA synthetase
MVHRLDNARLHTGGRLVSHVFETIDADLIPLKGFHFPEGPYVEFLNKRSTDVGGILERANDELKRAVSLGLEIDASYSNYNAIKSIRPQLAPFIPLDKPSRIVTIGDYIPLPCGGTHIENLSQIGVVHVTKTKRVKENTKVSYKVLVPE